MRIKKVTIFKDINKFREFKSIDPNCVRFSMDDIIDMLSIGDKHYHYSNSFLDSFIRTAMREEVDIVFQSSDDQYLDLILSYVKNRNSYNKRLSRDIIYELELLF